VESFPSLAFFLPRLIVAVFPVFAFLATLLLLDSYKLVTLRRVATTIGVGVAAAAVALFLNSLGFAVLPSTQLYAELGAPVVEELLKAAWLIVLIRRGRVGFMVDAAILGFGIGAGFALLENVVYLYSIPQAGLFTWVVRGFGTAVMHGGSTALFGVILRVLSDRFPEWSGTAVLPGLALSIVIHSGYNQSVLSPLANTLAIAGLLPLVMVFVFSLSEHTLRKWIGEGFDRDVELLRMIKTGQFLQSPAGRYLQSLKRSFPPAIVADMLCALNIRLELALRVKGDLLKREAGFDVTPDEATLARLAELQYLEKTIGPTGRLAMSPLLPRASRDNWQLDLLGYKSGG
jgi:protease PrsW